MEGWIKLHRKIQENPFYFSEPFTRSAAWMDMILIANHKEGIFYKRGVKVTVKRGQIGWDVDSIAKRWKWSRGKVERFYLELESQGQIVRQKNNVTTLISLVNYEEYQGDDKPEDKPSSKPNRKPKGKANGHQTVKQTDTNKNDKNNKNDKKGDDASDEAPQESIYKNFISVYDEFIKIKTNCPAKIDGVQGKAAKSIIEYLRRASNDKTDEGVINSWKFLLSKWDKIEPFYQGKLKLNEIESNLVNIIGQIKNGSGKQNSKGGEWDSFVAQRTGSGY